MGIFSEMDFEVKYHQAMVFGICPEHEVASEKTTGQYLLYYLTIFWYKTNLGDA